MPVVNDTNKYIDFNEGGAEINATISTGDYNAVALAAAVQGALDGAATATITTTYDGGTDKFTISSDGASFALLWNTGTNTLNNAGALLGYDESADDTGSVSYTSDFTRTYTDDNLDPYQPIGFIIHNRFGDKARMVIYDIADVAETINESIVLNNPLENTDIIYESLILSQEYESVKTFPVAGIDYYYYLGDTNGKVYTYSNSYSGDDGVAITSTWVSKVIDMSEQFSDFNDKFKTAFMVKVHYQDLTADTSLTISLSEDAGKTFTDETHTVGTGDGRIKSKLFFFHRTGQYFQVKVSESSATKDFCILGIELTVFPRGEWIDF